MLPYRSPDPSHPYYTISASPSASSAYSSFTDGSDDTDTVSSLLAADHSPRAGPSILARSRSHSDAYPTVARASDVDTAARRPRSCTVPGCDCHEAPATLRPAAFREREWDERDGAPSPAPSSAASLRSPALAHPARR